MSAPPPLRTASPTSPPPQPRVEWKLRIAAAQRGIWTGAELRRLLTERAGLELSAASVSALFTKQPSQVKLSTLAALCTALDCAPGDLMAMSTSTTAPPGAPAEPETPALPSSPPALTSPAMPRHRSLPPL